MSGTGIRDVSRSAIQGELSVWNVSVVSTNMERVRDRVVSVRVREGMTVLGWVWERDEERAGPERGVVEAEEEERRVEREVRMSVSECEPERVDAWERTREVGPRGAFAQVRDEEVVKVEIADWSAVWRADEVEGVRVIASVVKEGGVGVDAMVVNGAEV